MVLVQAMAVAARGAKAGLAKEHMRFAICCTLCRIATRVIS